MFRIIGKEEEKEEIPLTPEEEINILWKQVADKLGLVLKDPTINLYENSEGKFVLSKYGFVKQTYNNKHGDK